MPDLATFQQGFARTLADAATCAGALAVYRNTSRYGAVEALRANYPIAAAIVGPDMFDGITVEYAEVRPPRSPVLACYGRGFADWIENQPWAPDIPYLSDVARVERMHIEALFAEDIDPLAADSITVAGAIDWNRTRLRLHPATRFGWATTPAMSIWLAHQGDSSAFENLEWRSQGGLFVRPHGIICGEVLGSAAHRFLFGIRLGETVGAAALATAALYPDADVGDLFASLLTSGAFAAFESHERIV
jgi:Putative DNA-binding domain